jgi:hypothetical protein
MSRLSPVRLQCAEHFKGDHPIPLRHSCQHVRPRECRSRSDPNKLRFEKLEASVRSRDTDGAKRLDRDLIEAGLN